MSDLRELAELTEDVRAWLDHAQLRGGVAERVAESVAEEADRTAPGWTALAADSRERADSETGHAGLDRIRADLGDCRRCNLCKERRNIVFGVGSGEADLLVIGEAPGYNEDQQGEPFVGPAGQMLDKMLENVLGLGRQQVYISNVVKCRPPRNRNPLPDEIGSCLPFLERQVAAIEPKVILLLGSVALLAVLDKKGIKRHRGRWLEWRGVPVMPTYHPAYLLRQPEDKRQTFEDLKALKAKYDALGGRR